MFRRAICTTALYSASFDAGCVHCINVWPRAHGTHASSFWLLSRLMPPTVPLISAEHSRCYQNAPQDQDLLSPERYHVKKQQCQRLSVRIAFEGPA